MPKMGGDDKEEKKEDSAESKAEKEAAVSSVIGNKYHQLMQKYVL